MIVRIEDVRRAGYCVRGVRHWTTLNAIDFNDFLKNGIESDRLEALNDTMAQRVVNMKREQESS